MGGGKRTYELCGVKPTQQRIECGFPPRIIFTFDMTYASSHKITCVYNKDINPNGFTQNYDGTVGQISLANDQQLYNVDDTGFNLVYYQNYSTNCTIIAIE